MDDFGEDLKSDKEFEVNEVIKNIKRIKQRKTNSREIGKLSKKGT